VRKALQLAWSWRGSVASDRYTDTEMELSSNRAQVQAPDRPAGNRSSCSALLIGMTFLDSAPGLLNALVS
jgi:hypothetical protein